MTLDNKYIIMPPLQQVIHDKEDGSLLAGGKVTFYKDAARTVPKNVYSLTGTPPDYTYHSLGNVLTLSSIGSYVDDNGANIIVMLYPYDDKGNLELYYITVVSADGTEQFDVPAIPRIAADSPSDLVTDVKNLVPNGQFWHHQNIGQAQATRNAIAWGGWYYDLPEGTHTVDNISFQRFGTISNTPPGHPRYALRIQCVTPNGSDPYKDLHLAIKNAGSLLSASQTWTLSFWAQSLQTQELPIKIQAITDGTTPAISTPQTNITVDTTGGYFNIPLVFGDGNGATVASDSDFLGLLWYLPVSYAFDMLITDVSLVQGSVKLTNFPVETVSECTYKSLAGFIDTPSPDINTPSSDIGKVIILTRTGFRYEPLHPVASLDYLAVPWNHDVDIWTLHCDGGVYDCTATDPRTGISYARLNNRLHEGLDWNNNWEPRYGTGWNQCTAVLLGIPDPNTFDLAWNTGTTAAPFVTNGTTNFTFGALQTEPTAGNPFQAITLTAGNTITAGMWFRFITPGNQSRVVWYKKNGAGDKPNVSADRFIEVDVTDAYTAQNVKDYTIQGINGAFFAVPYANAMFPRIWARGSAWDPDRDARMPAAEWAINVDGSRKLTRWGGVWGDSVGSRQWDENQSHLHKPAVNHLDGGQCLGDQSNAFSSGGAGMFGPGDVAHSFPTEFAGGNEARPKNMYVDVGIFY